MPYSSLGRPATAFRPMLGMTEPLNTHTSDPSGLALDLRGRLGVAGREPALEHVRRFDQVVVDADEDQVSGVHSASLPARTGTRQLIG